MTTLEAKRIQKYVEDREKQHYTEKDRKINTWKDVFAKTSIGAVEKAGHKRLNHQLYTQQSELHEEQRLLEKLDEREQAAHRAAQETLLAEQLVKLRDDKLRDEKERLRVRQESEELKLLERQLYQAYVNKERHLQLQEKRLEKHQHQMEQQRDKAALDVYTEQHDLEQKEKERQRLVDSARYLEGLRMQFVEKDLQKESEFQQFLKEKAVIDEVVRQIEEEDKRMVRERSERMERLKQQMEEELASRQRQREELKMQSAAHDKLAVDYAAEMERRDTAIEAARQQRLAELRRLQERLAEQMRSRQQLVEEERLLREQLEIEQRRAAGDKAERDEVQRQVCRVQEQRRTIELQLQQKEQQKRDELLQREAMHKTMMEKLAEEERLELLTLAARRRRELDHRRQVEAMMAENRRRRDEEIAQLCSEKRELERMEQDRLRMVEQERRRLLEQHAIKLVDFLPKGVFRDKRELEELGARSEAVEKLQETEKEANYVNIC